MTIIPALLFDVGNTRLKWGVLADGRISKTGSVTHEKLRESGFSAITTRVPRNVSTIAVSNVAGSAFGTRLSGVMGMHCNADIRFAHCEKKAYGVTSSYRQPRRLGVDRWFALIGAWNEFRSALCVVDAGTATTIDAIDKSGQHLGGQIIPGMRLMGESLQRKTSDIAPSGRYGRDPGNELGIFGKNTNDAIANGVLTATCGAIEFAVTRMRRAKLRPKIVLTGGDASRILKQLNSNVIHRPNLVLQGLSIMLQSDT